MFNLKYFAHFW